jgi:hypothetical protein
MNESICTCTILSTTEAAIDHLVCAYYVNIM